MKLSLPLSLYHQSTLCVQKPKKDLWLSEQVSLEKWLQLVLSQPTQLYKRHLKTLLYERS